MIYFWGNGKIESITCFLRASYQVESEPTAGWNGSKEIQVEVVQVRNSQSREPIGSHRRGDKHESVEIIYN